MLNTNYTYVNPIVHQHTDNLAKGVPHHTVDRNISQPIENTQNIKRCEIFIESILNLNTNSKKKIKALIVGDGEQKQK